MPSSFPRAVTLTAALCLLPCVSAAPALAQSQSTAGEASRTIEVYGEGTARAKPDRASTTLTVVRTGESARNAMNEVNATMAQVIDAMKALGVEDGDLQTGGLSINPQLRYDNDGNEPATPPKIVGYQVSNSLDVKIRDIAKVGDILGRAIDLGVNQGGDISFEVSDMTQPRNEARRQAVADAAATAGLLAQAAGVDLGPVRSIVDASSEQSPPVMRSAMKTMAAASSASVPVEAGENTVEARVHMIFEIGSDANGGKN